MDRDESSAESSSSSRTADDVDGELAALERRRAELEREKASRAKAERGPADRREALIVGFVDLAVAASQHRPVNELRARAERILEAIS